MDGGDQVFRIDAGGAISQILDATGDGFAAFTGAADVAVDEMGNVIVVGIGSDNTFKIDFVEVPVCATPAFLSPGTGRSRRLCGEQSRPLLFR